MPKRPRLSWTLVLIVITPLAALSLLAERPRVYAITGVQIVPRPGALLEAATIVLRDGLVEAIGADAPIPPDAQVIEGQEGWTVYPAFIDAASYVGLKEEQQQEGGAGFGPPNIAQLLARRAQQEEKPGAAHERTAIHPEELVVDQLDAGDDKIGRYRKIGFAIAHTLPRGGVFQGQSAIFALRPGELRELLIRDRYAQVVSLQSGGFFSANYPTSKIGAVAAIRQALLDAQRAADWQNRYQDNPVGLMRPEFRSSDGALIDLLAKNVPAVFVALTTLDHERFGRLANEFGLRGMTLALGCTEESHRVQAAGMPVLLPLDFPKKPPIDKEEELKETSLETLQQYLRAPRLPAELASSNVKFALVTAKMSSLSDFQRNLAKAVEAGLSSDDALAALTTTPAELLGLSQVAGTLEPGKMGNLIVVEGELFTEKPSLRYLFVDGRHEEFEVEEPKGDPTAEVDPRGVWEVTTEVMGRSQESTWTIEGSPGAFSGFSESSRGRRDFESINLEGNALTVTLSTPMGSREITVIVTGDQFEGETSFDTPGGSISLKLSGRRLSGPEGDDDE